MSSPVAAKVESGQFGSVLAVHLQQNCKFLQKLDELS